MEVGDLFTLKSSREAVKTIYRVEDVKGQNACNRCIGFCKPLCHKLPISCCSSDIRYLKLTKREAEKARKSGQVIIEY